MSIKKNQSPLDKRSADRLFGAAAKKMGQDPEKMKQDFQNGRYDSALSSLSRKDAAMLKKALSDPELTAKVLDSPQAKAIFRKLSEK